MKRINCLNSPFARSLSFFYLSRDIEELRQLVDAFSANLRRFNITLVIGMAPQKNVP